MRKKWLAILACVAMVAALFAGCGGSGGSSDKGGDDADSIKVGFIFLHDENSTYDLNFINAAKEAGKQLGIPEENVIPQHLVGDFGKPRFGVSVGGRGVAVHGTEVADINR